MVDDITQALQTAAPTLWRDLIGITALAVAFGGIVHLPWLLSF